MAVSVTLSHEHFIFTGKASVLHLDAAQGLQKGQLMAWHELPNCLGPGDSEGDILLHCYFHNELFDYAQGIISLLCNAHFFFFEMRNAHILIEHFK